MESKTVKQIIIDEMDCQVGVYDGEDKYSGVGVVIDNSYHYPEFYCGFSNVHRLEDSTKKEAKVNSRKEWVECANEVIGTLSDNGLYFTMEYATHNGFIIVSRS